MYRRCGTAGPSEVLVGPSRRGKHEISKGLVVPVYTTLGDVEDSVKGRNDSLDIHLALINLVQEFGNDRKKDTLLGANDSVEDRDSDELIVRCHV
jgi:hypothetical protein